jgi:hypothetical protein
MHMSAERQTRKAIKADSLPQSWLVKDWPANIAPGNPVAARAFIRRNRPALIRCGAVTRIGKEITVIGVGFAQFLTENMRNVEGWQCPANKRRGPAQTNAA